MSVCQLLLDVLDDLVLLLDHGPQFLVFKLRNLLRLGVLFQLGCHRPLQGANALLAFIMVLLL